MGERNSEPRNGAKEFLTVAPLSPRSGALQLATGTHGSRRGLGCFALRAWCFGCGYAALRGGRPCQAILPAACRRLWPGSARLDRPRARSHLARLAVVIRKAVQTAGVQANPHEASLLSQALPTRCSRNSELRKRRIGISPTSDTLENRRSR